MPGQLARITSTFFTSVINRLGLRPAFDEGWLVSNVVQPVSIVDSDISLNAVSSTITLESPFTAGPLAAGTAANTVHADTGAQSAGRYAVLIMFGHDQAAGTYQCYLIQRRNAANAANIWEQQIAVSTGMGATCLSLTLTLAAGERLRVINKVLSNFTTEQASIWLQTL